MTCAIIEALVRLEYNFNCIYTCMGLHKCFNITHLLRGIFELNFVPPMIMHSYWRVAIVINAYYLSQTVVLATLTGIYSNRNILNSSVIHRSHIMSFGECQCIEIVKAPRRLYIFCLIHCNPKPSCVLLSECSH